MSAPDGAVSSPGLVAQFGVGAATAAAIVNALNSWWAAALSLVLVPLGLGSPPSRSGRRGPPW